MIMKIVRVALGGLLVSGLLAGTWISDADAAVVCQKGKNKVKLRRTACKKKEVLAVDLSAVDTRLASFFETACPGDPSRTLVTTGPSFLFDGDRCQGSCRTLDGDQAACEQSFEVNWYGPAACVYLDGKCVSCLDCGQRAGRCIDACQPISCADPTRTLFKGGPNTKACRQLTTEADCTKGWASTYGRGRPVSCYWDAGASRCRGCGSSNEHNGNCTNTCREPLTCADAGRTFAPSCGDFSGDQAGCLVAWTNGNDGTEAVSCYYDTDDNSCDECELLEALAGQCSNTCE